MAASRLRCALRSTAASIVPYAALLLAFAAGAQEAAPPASATPSELDALVERVALYPDELLALVLPAATEPIQIVEAARFLDAHAKNAALKPKESWSDPVQSLLNYPDVVRKMNDDLEWTQALGNAVVNDQGAVMEAVQQVRARAKAAGNLKENAQQKVVETREVIEIHSADPEVIYVPRYDPQVIYVPAPAPVVSYYPPAPCYWCPAATFGVGMMVGATTAWAFNWASHDIFWGPPGFRPGFHNDFDFERNVNIDRDVDIGDIHIGDNVNVKGGDKKNFQGGQNRPNDPTKPGNQWKPDRKPGQGGGGQASRPGGGGGTQRPTTRPGAGGGGTQRPTTKPARPPASGGFDRPASGQRPSGGGTARPSDRPGYDRPSDKGSFGGYERGRDSVQNSHRGSSSRERSGQASGSSGSRSSMDRGSGSSRSASSFGGYSSGSRSSAQSSRGSHSRGGGGGGGHRGGGGGGGGGKRR